MKTVQMLYWDGTIESFNNIANQLFPRDLYQIEFIDEQMDWTNEFTNSFIVIFLPHYSETKDIQKEYEKYKRCYEGLTFKAPCVLPKEVEETNE